jgi:putative DNA primase/helicase
MVEGEHPIMNGEAQRIPAVNDKRGELTIFYVAHEDGVPNGYAENNRTKQVIRWKATGQHLSPEAKAALAAQADQNRYARKQTERKLYEATAQRLSEELRINNSGVKPTEYHKAKQIEATPGAPSRNGDVWVPGYDVDGKLWTVQYIKEDGTKRFAKDSRKHGCFHLGGNPWWWGTATLATAGTFLAIDAMQDATYQPPVYDYGANVVYQGDDVYWSLHNLGDATAFKKRANQGRAFRHSF